MDNRKIDLAKTYQNVNDADNGNGLFAKVDGVSGYYRVINNRGMTELTHIKTAGGRRSKAYRETRRKLGDDFDSYWTGEWPEDFFALVESSGLVAYC